MISMVCVRADPDGGGRSRVLDIDTLREEVRARLGSRMLEFLALEPGCDPIGGRDNPLQEGVGLVVGSRRVYERVGGFDISGIFCEDAADEG